MTSPVQLPRRPRQVASRVGTPRVLVLGNPNAGKTSLFNRLAGTNLRVGNYPGVTVEHALATVLAPGGPIELVDLPGTYSLCGRSAEERIAVDALLGHQGQSPPDAVVLVIDVTQLQRGLYLALQVVELGLPTVLALNMADEAARMRIDVDLAGLSEAIGVPTLPVSARTGEGVVDLLARVALVLDDPTRGRSTFRTPLPENIEPALLLAAAAAEELGGTPRPESARAVGLWALMSVEASDDEPAPPALVARLDALRAGLGLDLDEAVTAARYAWIDRVLPPLVTRPPGEGRSATDRIDAVLVHPVWGFTLFLLLMTLLFQGLFSWSDPAIGLVEALFLAVGDGLRAILPTGLFADFLVDGLLAGVGAVVVFLPQILLLFLLIGLMEDSGYMARVAYLMDRVMRSVGLHGRAFVPLLSGFACAVPAVLATRTMERRRDRLLTMMVVPLTTCSARLPVYTLLIAALFPATVRGMPLQGLVLAAMYLLSVGTALVAAAVMGRTILKGGREPLILELPPYRLPRAITVFRMMWDRSRLFLTEAGTVILVCTVVLWGLLTFPRVENPRPGSNQPAFVAQVDQSYAAGLGKAIEPMIAPLGFDWTIGVGLIGSFAAREVFVATMGVVYGLDGDVDEASEPLRERMRKEVRADGTPVWTPLVGLSLMVFFAFAAQCMSTLAAVKRETRSWRWPLFLMVYMTVLAYVASLIVYQGGRALGFG